MRKSFLVASVATLALGTAGLAYAQDTTTPSIEATGSGSPSKAGKKTKPKAVTFKLDVKNNQAARTTAKSVKITFPSTIKVSTKGLNECRLSDEQIINNPEQCKSSFAGTGKASANLNPFSTTPAPLAFEIQPIVGRGELLFLLSGAANTILHGKIKGQTMTIAITPDLQQPAPGTFSALGELAATIKSTKGKNSLISAVGCKGKKHTIGVEVAYAPNPNPPAASSAKDSFDIKCSK